MLSEGFIIIDLFFYFQKNKRKGENITRRLKHVKNEIRKVNAM